MEYWSVEWPAFWSPPVVFTAVVPTSVLSGIPGMTAVFPPEHRWP